MSSNQQQNEAAFRSATNTLNKQFPVGHFVAFDRGELIADAATFDELTEVLTAKGADRTDIFVAQTGIEYPNEVYILLLD
ncbi:MAG: hypothetical protein SGI77_25665 [Pirellulaceae bacterium]|nr:hypothetical protein [Pirellulaceae bacterium]